MCEPPEQYLWSRWLCPELDKDYIESYATELTYNFRRAKGERLVVPGGIETVKELRKRGYLVGIISDLVGTIEIDEWLDHDGIRDLFCTVQQSSITMLRKPHPAIYYLALKEAGVRPEESTGSTAYGTVEIWRFLPENAPAHRGRSSCRPYPDSARRKAVCPCR